MQLVDSHVLILEVTLDSCTRRMSDAVNTFRPITTDRTDSGRLAVLEKKIRGRLPDAYRQFLLSFNGGKPTHRAFKFMERGREFIGALRYLYGDCNERLYSIEDRLEVYSGRIPEYCLPIGCDSFGNLILLSLGKEDYGSVYFWDHERELPRPGGWDNVYRISLSFEEFVAGLMETNKLTH